MTWPGTYFDGRTAARHDVAVSFGADGLELRHAGGALTVWPYWSIRGTASQSRVDLETKGELPEKLTVAAPGFEPELRRQFPALLDSGTAATGVVLKVAGIGFGATAILGVALWIASPWIGQAVASLIPVSWEEKLGEAVVRALAPESKRCKDPAIAQKMERILDELKQTTGTGYRFRLYVVDDKIVNAFAAPGGFIVLNRGLIEKTRSPEEVAGVLAHEMQHVVQRHGTRAMLRGLGIRILLAAMIGDAGWLYDLTGTLGELHFLRQDEESADIEGMKSMQAARLDPMGMVELLKTLDKEAGDLPGAIRYLSSHPQTRDRIAAMEKLARQADYTPRRLMQGTAWPPPLDSCSVGTR